MSLDGVYEAILDGNANAATAETQAAVDAGVSAPEILQQACIPAMTEVGRLFEIGEIFVPQMLISARAMKMSLEILKPLLVDSEVQTVGKVVIGTVAGDLHDIGKNLVAIMLEGAGFEIIDLGTDTSPEAFVDAVQEHKPDLLGMSALLTTTLPGIGETIEALTKAGVRGNIKIIIGGAPVTQEFANKVGADGFAPDAGSAPRLAKSLLGVA